MSAGPQNGEAAGGERMARLKLDVMLTEANRLRSRGLVGEAGQKCREAMAADGNYAPAHELMGDILRQQGMVNEAIACYQAALRLNPERGAVEEKIARVCVTLAGQRYGHLWLQDDVTEGKERNQAGAALLSMIVPGIGQLYKRQLAKGFVFLGLFMFVLMMIMGRVLDELMGKPTVRDYVSLFFGGRNVYGMVLLAGVWLGAVIDAGLSKC